MKALAAGFIGKAAGFIGKAVDSIEIAAKDSVRIVTKVLAVIRLAFLVTRTQLTYQNEI